MKVKRGLGLLVVAVAAFVLARVIAVTATGHGTALDLFAWPLVLVALLGCLVAGVAGLVLLVRGLLAD